MRILITGNRGFVGSATQHLLEEAGHEVIGFDIMDGRDIRDTDYSDLFSETDRVLHLAAVARFSDADADPKLAFETNVLGTKMVVDECKNRHLPLVYASTGSVYMPIEQEPPITEDFPARGNSVYGCTKYMGELYVKEHTPHIILRYAHLYGKEKRGHGLVGGFVDRIQRGLSPQLYGGSQSNDFCYIRDVAQANYIALTAEWDKWNQVYNIGTGEEIVTKKAAELICAATGYTGSMDVRPERSVDAQRFVYDTTKAERLLGFRASYNFEQGLADMFKEEKEE